MVGFGRWRRSSEVPDSLQASAAFLFEVLLLASAPSAFLEPLRGRLMAAAAAVPFVLEASSWSGLSVPSGSLCSRQHSWPVGPQRCSAPSWWALQKELGQSWQKASEFFPHTSQWCHGQSQRPAGTENGLQTVQAATHYQAGCDISWWSFLPKGLLERFRQDRWYALVHVFLPQSTSCPPSPQRKHSSSDFFPSVRFLLFFLFNLFPFGSAVWPLEFCGDRQVKFS